MWVLGVSGWDGVGARCGGSGWWDDLSRIERMRDGSGVGV